MERKEVVKKIDEIDKADVKEIEKKENIEEVEIEILCKEKPRKSQIQTLNVSQNMTNIALESFKSDFEHSKSEIRTPLDQILSEQTLGPNFR